ncbi:hypothetical protein BGZ93_010601 [Podila epicladia]|nr:hypothetical protein BGZ92_002151 [Podila epicladia]KAG0098719.1 hypothetical protein BGZ93_010601 [Podila epicladia]
MHKSLLVLSALVFAQLTLAQNNWYVTIKNNDGSKFRHLAAARNYRFCYCLSKTQTATIDGTIGGNVKLFSKSDCTGSFSDGSGKVTKNAQWVNSVSFGVSGMESEYGGGDQCNQYEH